eukprot:g119.t1
MMTSKQSSRSTTVDKFLESLTEDVRERVEKLRGIQEKCDVVKQDFLKERKALEEKYRLIFDPLFKERAEVVAGSGQFPDTCEEPGLVPGFWLRVLKNGDMVGENISKRDEPILKYLLDIRNEPIEDNKPGFKLVFKFAKNPYFTPLILEKKYLMGGDDESQLENTEGTEINWMENKNPAIKIVQKAGKAGEQAKFKKVQKHSFFDFFSAPAIPQTDNPDEVADIVELLAEDDLELGCCIKEMLLPSAVSWYTGEIGVDALIKGEGETSSSDEGSEESSDDEDE